MSSMLRSRQSGARAFQRPDNLKFDTEYNDGVFGMTDGVRVHCPKCGKYGLYFDDFQKIQQGKIKPQAILILRKHTLGGEASSHYHAA
ncbi:hypothetical protein [Escherichia coli]|uniref:hypothetical protein n=1 Tax=Escherichia coli TaxID=562 RepID=UPI002FCCEEBE